MGGRRWAARVARTRDKVVAGRLRQVRQWLVDQAISHLCADKPGGKTGEQDKLCNAGFQRRETKASKPVAVKTYGGAVAAEIPSLTEEFTGVTHRVLECTQTHPPGNQPHKGPICLWVVGEVTESGAGAKHEALFPL